MGVGEAERRRRRWDGITTDLGDVVDTADCYGVGQSAETAGRAFDAGTMSCRRDAYFEAMLAKESWWTTEGPREQDIEFVDGRRSRTSSSLQQDRLDALVDSAPPAVADPQAFIDRFRSIQEEWTAVITDGLDVPLVEGGGEAVLEARRPDTRPDRDRRGACPPCPLSDRERRRGWA